jgi:hypothetical protein
MCCVDRQSCGTANQPGFFGILFCVLRVDLLALCYCYYLTAVVLTPGGSRTVHIVLTPGGSRTVHIVLTPGDSRTVHIVLTPGGSSIHLHTNSTQNTEDGTHITITRKKINNCKKKIG